MTPHVRPLAPRRRRRLHAGGYALIALIALLAVIAAALDPATLPDIVAMLRRFTPTRSDLQALLGVALLMLALGVALHAGLLRPLWHWSANTFGVDQPQALGRPWVIDGDTIDDRATGVRYRLANIDAPETGDNAKCFNERIRGEQATREAITLVRRADIVAVRRTFRFDQYGRRVAFVLVDGEDLGELLVARGLARPWQGWRRRWCGRKGGLARIAAAGAMPHACKTCERW